MADKNDLDTPLQIGITPREWQLFCQVMRGLTWGTHPGMDSWHRLRETFDARFVEARKPKEAATLLFAWKDGDLANSIRKTVAVASFADVCAVVFGIYGEGEVVICGCGIHVDLPNWRMAWVVQFEGRHVGWVNGILDT